MKVTFAALLVGVLAACGGGSPSSAATVDGTEISVAEVEEQYEALAQNPQMQQQFEGADDDQVEQQLQADALNQLIFEVMLSDGADDLGVEVSDEDVQETREEIVMQFGGDEDAMYEQLEAQGLDREEIDRQLEFLTLQEAVMSELGGGVSDEDIEAVYEEGTPARHILVEDEEGASAALERIEGGEDFADVAQETSADGSAEQGGDLGFIQPGQTVPEFEEALFAAEEGEVVGPIESQFGFHVVERLEKPAIEEVSDEIQMGLEQQSAQEDQMAFQQFITERMQEAEVEVNPRFGEWDPEMGQVVPDEPLQPEQPQMPEGAEEAPVDPEDLPEELQEELEELEELEEPEDDADADADE